MDREWQTCTIEDREWQTCTIEGSEPHFLQDYSLKLYIYKNTTIVFIFQNYEIMKIPSHKKICELHIFYRGLPLRD